MASSEILQEYLVKIGYHTDATTFHKFEASLGKTTKNVYKLGGAVIAIAAATAAATTSFAYNMRKMYFASELANSSVKNLRAMEYAGKQIGISGDAMESSITGMARALRLEPGLAAFLQNMGVPVSGRDVSDVMIDLVSALKKMPEYQAAQIAEMFGISPDEFHQMSIHLDELKKKKLEHLEIYREMGVDIDAAKNVNMEYTQTLDRMGERMEALSDKVLIKLLPAFKELSKETDSFVAKISKDMDIEGTFMNEFIQVLNSYMSFEKPKGVGSFWGEIPSALGNAWVQGAKDFGSDVQKALNWMVPKVIAAESGGNPNATSNKGAAGLMQLMPATAKRFGATNPYDPEQNVSAGKKYLEWLLKRYNNNVDLASAAYNWGEGNVDSLLKTGHGIKTKRNPEGIIPTETQNYVNKVTGGNLGTYSDLRRGDITQTNTFNITGNDANQIADSVANKQNRLWADVTRNTRVVVQ